MIRATVVVLLTGAAAAHAQGSAAINRTLTSIEGVRVGQHTLVERPTGCTVVLFDGEAVGGVSQRGAAPGTRETDLLNPNNMVDRINAIVLSGGSAYELDAANGAVRWLDEHNIGWGARGARVPLGDVGARLRSGAAVQRATGGENTELAVMPTNARITKSEVNRVASMADVGVARTLVPAHTADDGDTVFPVAPGALAGNDDIT